MKKIYTLILAVTSLAATAQTTNTFPTSGNVGIGTTSPTELLTVSGMNPIRGTFLTLDDQAITDRTGVRIRFQSKGIAHWNMGIPADVDAFTINGWSGAANPEYFRINSSGNVGIGTVSPSSLLHINGITSVRNNTLTDGYLTINPGGPTTQGYINWWKPGDIRVAYMGYNDGSGVNNLGLTLENASFIINGGNVGIGTSTPNSKLAVNGNIRAHEVKVETANWPDYVFAKDYQLPTLQETEKHIKDKGHLPGIPSAAEVKANGLDLGEMNAKLLQKIEELTLHLIRLEKENAKQREDINELKSKRD